MATREQFATDWLAGLGVPPYEGGLVALVNLMYAEGSRALNNPDDTIQPEAGAIPFNTFDGNLHVWNYPNYEEGVKAAIETMRNGNNTEVVNALTARLSAETVTQAIVSHSSWSSAGNLYLETLPHVQSDYKAEASVQVAGSQAQPAEGTPAEEATETPAAEKVEDQPVSEVQAVETDAVGDAGAVANDANEAVADAKAGKVAAMRDELAQAKTHIANLETHLSELEALVK